MSEQVITSTAQVSEAWLTDVLIRNGALTAGAVAAIELGTGQGNWSTNANLHVFYSAGAQGELPQRLFLKMVFTDAGDEYFSDSEVRYYTHDYIDVANAPLLRCYDTAYSDALNRYHLLLDDVSETHVEAAEQEPTLAYGLVLAEGLAALHARWWGADRMAEAGAPLHSAGFIQRFVEIAQPGVGHILANCAEELHAHWPQAIHELYAGHPQAIIERTQDASGFTLIHGDVGHNNILVPRTGGRPLYIIDRQPFDWSLTTWLGVYDLAYAIVLDWEVERRRQYEMQILAHYHKCLVENGVSGYSRDRLVDDYRLCAAMGVYIATEYCRGRLNERSMHIWLPMLKRALTACDDLDCRALW